MIDQVKTNPYNSNAYSAFSTRNAMPYAVTTSIESKKVKQEKAKEEKHNRLGLKIGIGALVVGLGVFGFMKGLPKSTRGKLNDFFRGLDDKIANSENKKLNQAQAFYLSILKKLKIHAPKIKMIYNSAPLKDVFVKKNFERVPILNSFTKWTTRIFEKVSVKTAAHAYKRTLNRFKNLNEYLDVVDKKLLSMDPNKLHTMGDETKPVKQWLDEIRLMRANIDTNLSKFSEDALKGRVNQAKSDMSGIYNQVWEQTYGDWKNMYKNKNLTEKFLSEELAAQAKMKLNDEINALRKSITNDISDNYGSTKKIVEAIDNLLAPDDKTAGNLIKKTKRILEEYNNISGPTEDAQRLGLNTTISSYLDELKGLVSNSSKYDKKVVEQVDTSIETLRKNLQNNPKGDIQKILTIYKNLLPKNEYMALKKEAYSAVNSLNRSVDREGDKLFDKLRDLEIGSAPTDALGVISSIGAVGVALPLADDREGRTSVALKYGIPAIGAVATTLYCTMGLVSGGASLLWGTLSGLVINKVGVVLDNYIKKNNAAT